MKSIAKAGVNKREAIRKAKNQKEHELTPRNGFFKSLFEAWLAIEKQLRNR